MSDFSDQDDVDLLCETEDVKNVLENWIDKKLETIDLDEIYDILEVCLKNGTTKELRLKLAADIMERRLQKIEQKRRRHEEAIQMNDEIYRKETNDIFKPLLELPTSYSEGVKRFVMLPKNDMDWTNPLDILYMAAEATFLRMVDQSPDIAGGITRRSIVSIEYIENNFNTILFLAKRDKFIADGINNRERLCFHGTTIKNIDSILQNNFSDDKIKRCSFGRGHYFSEFPDKSAGYGPGLLLCRVLLGKSWTDKSHENIPAGYNSKVVRPDQDGKGMIIVIPDSHQIVPAFVIKLREELMYPDNQGRSHYNSQLNRTATPADRYYARRRAMLTALSHTNPSASHHILAPSRNVSTVLNSGNPNVQNVRVRPANGNPYVSTSTHPSFFGANVYAYPGVSMSTISSASGGSLFPDTSPYVPYVPISSGPQANFDAHTSSTLSISSNLLSSRVSINSDSAAHISHLAQSSASGGSLFPDTSPYVPNMPILSGPQANFDAHTSSTMSNSSNPLSSRVSINSDSAAHISHLAQPSASGCSLFPDTSPYVPNMPILSGPQANLDVYTSSTMSNSSNPLASRVSINSDTAAHISHLAQPSISGPRYTLSPKTLPQPNSSIEVVPASRKKDFEVRRKKRDEKKKRSQNQNGEGRSRSKDRIVQTEHKDEVEQGERKTREESNSDGEERSRSVGEAKGNKSGYRDIELDNLTDYSSMTE